jgi:hypothetical protein
MRANTILAVFIPNANPSKAFSHYIRTRDTYFEIIVRVGRTIPAAVGTQGVTLVFTI